MNNHDVSRRDFLAVMGAGLLAPTIADAAGTAAGDAAQQNTPASGRKMFAYVASWTSGPGIGQGNGGGVSVFSVDQATGALTPVMRTGMEFDKMNAGYLAVNPNGKFLYATNEVESYDDDWGGGGVMAFAINQSDGSIAHVNTQQSMGVWPAYISIDKTGSRLTVANHGNYDPSIRVVKKNGVPEIEKIWDDGVVTMLPIKADGSVDHASDAQYLERTTSVDKTTQRSAHAHSVNWDPSQRMVVVCDKGCDRVYTYKVANGSKKLEPGTVLKVEPGTAPRHSSLHPRLPYVYIVNERQSSLGVYHIDPASADIQLVEKVPTIPADFTRNSSPADVHVHPNGKFVYASNRGHDSIAIFAIDEATGKMTLVDIAPSGGRTPRGFQIEPGGRFLLSGNQATGNVVTYAIDQSTGKITPTGAKADVPRPVCIQFGVI